jgi:hypothetical protein
MLLLCYKHRIGLFERINKVYVSSVLHNRKRFFFIFYNIVLWFYTYFLGHFGIDFDFYRPFLTDKDFVDFINYFGVDFYKIFGEIGEVSFFGLGDVFWIFITS